MDFSQEEKKGEILFFLLSFAKHKKSIEIEFKDNLESTRNFKSTTFLLFHLPNICSLSSIHLAHLKKINLLRFNHKKKPSVYKSKNW